MQDRASLDRLNRQLDGRIEEAVLVGDINLEQDLQSQKARINEIDAKRAADMANASAIFRLEQTADSDPVKRMEDEVFLIRDTFRQGVASGTLDPSVGSVRAQQEVETLIRTNPEAAALSEQLNPILQEMIDRQVREQEELIPPERRAAERRAAEPFIEHPAVPFQRAERVRRERSALDRLDPTTGAIQPLGRGEQLRRNIRDSLLGRPGEFRQGGLPSDRPLSGFRRFAERGIRDPIESLLNPQRARQRAIQRAVAPAAPEGEVIVRDGQLFLLLPGGQAIPLPENIPTPIRAQERGTLPGFPGL
jgi:hypothetical protein